MAVQTATAAVILFLALFAPFTRPLLRPYTKGRSDVVAALVMLAFAAVTFTAGVVIAEWWALLLALAAVLSGIPMLRRLDSDDEKPRKSVEIPALIAFTALEVLPVALGIVVAS